MLVFAVWWRSSVEDTRQDEEEEEDPTHLCCNGDWIVPVTRLRGVGRGESQSGVRGHRCRRRRVSHTVARVWSHWSASPCPLWSTARRVSVGRSRG